VSNGVNRVDSFSLNLTNHVTGFVANGQAGLGLPSGTAYGPDGNLYVAGRNNSSVDRFLGPLSLNPGGNDPSTGNSGATWSSNSVAPAGLAVTPDGTFYDSDQTGNGTIYRFDSTTGVGTVAATNIFSGSTGQIAINSAGTSLFVRDAGKIFDFTINPDHSLTSVSFSLTYAAGSNDLGSFAGLTFGPDGFLYAATRTPNGNSNPNLNTDYVVRVDPSTGVATTFAANVQNLGGGQNPTYLLFTSVPEPGSLTIAATGAAIGLCLWIRRRRRPSQNANVA
jgi:glucose/arabinose dehydrogenase